MQSESAVLAELETSVLELAELFQYMARLVDKPRITVRAVDIKPLDEWYQRHEQAENVRLDLQQPHVLQRAPPAALAAALHRRGEDADVDVGGLHRELVEELVEG